MKRTMIYFCLPFLFAFFLSANLTAQSSPSSKPASFSLEISSGILFHDLLKTPVWYTRCIEGCPPLEQEGGRSAYYALSLGWQFRPRIQFRLGWMTHSRKLEETLEDLFGGNIFTLKRAERFHGIHPSIQWDFISGEKLAVFIENGLLLERPAQKNSRLVDFPLSYTNKIGLRFGARQADLAFKVNTLLFIPLSSFHQGEPIPGFEPYLPFAMGLSGGLELRF